MRGSLSGGSGAGASFGGGGGSAGGGGGGGGRASLGYAPSRAPLAPASGGGSSRNASAAPSRAPTAPASAGGGGAPLYAAAPPSSSYSSRLSLTRASGGSSGAAPGARSRGGSGSAAEAVPWGRSAAQSHLANDAYMGDWDRAYQELYGEASVAKEGQGPKPILSMAPAHALAKFSERRPRGGLEGPCTGTAAAAAAGATARSGGGGGGGGGGGELAALASAGPMATLALGQQPGEAVIVAGHFIPPPHPALTPNWLRAPLNPQGALIDLSDRPLMAHAISPRACASSAEAVIAGSDHAAYTVDLLRGTRTRTLHGGRYGHREWVTGVTYLGDLSDRVASCGMDGKVCLWEAGSGATKGSARCSDLLGHFGSVSAVASPGGGAPACGPPSARAGHVLVSAGYDKSVRVWDTRRTAAAAGGGGGGGVVLSGHGAPVLCLALRARDAVGTALCASGDRSGSARLWDLAAGAGVGVLGGHGGHVTALAWLCGGAQGGGEDLVLTGAQDGCVRVWDPRAAGTDGGTACIATVPAHVAGGGGGGGGRGGGSGAVGDIGVARCGGSAGALGYARAQHEAGGMEEGAGEALIVSSGADKRLCVIDPRGGWRVRHELPGHSDFIYTLACVGGLALSGGGDGLLLAHNVASGEVLWGLGANEAAVRCIGVCATGPRSRQVMLAAGDDGKCLVYDF